MSGPSLIAIIDGGLRQMGERRLGKIANRSVVGTRNGFTSWRTPTVPTPDP
ncbi:MULTISPECIES: hypothetical protein [unclassified Spirillospora]|uniref:hypothetical protein n=1 Tax=unclassified Spirillospora TaxID=2642701 RepID=UPI00371A08F1